MNIFETLQKKKICFAVGNSINTFKSKALENTSRDFFLIAIIANKKRLKGLAFIESNTNKLLLERSLTPGEIIEFTEIQSEFTTVIRNDFGKVYELKNNSFKDFYTKFELKQQEIKKLTTFD